MRKDITVRRADPRDLDTIVRFNLAMALETENLALDPQVLRAGVTAALTDDRKGCYYLARIDAHVIGQLMITYEWSDWRSAWFWWIQSVYVTPEFRKQGAFRTLFSHVRDLAGQTPDVCGLRLYVHRENHKAQTVYAALGMRKTEYDALFELTFPRRT